MLNRRFRLAVHDAAYQLALRFLRKAVQASGRGGPPARGRGLTAPPPHLKVHHETCAY